MIPGEEHIGRPNRKGRWWWSARGGETSAGWIGTRGICEGALPRGFSQVRLTWSNVALVPFPWSAGGGVMRWEGWWEGGGGHQRLRLIAAVLPLKF